MMNGTRLDEIARDSATLAAPLYAAFRAYLRTKHGTDYLPQGAEDALYSKAYEMGHSGGYAEVETLYTDLSELALAVYESR